MFRKISIMIRSIFETLFGWFLKNNAGSVAKAALSEQGDNIKEARKNAGENQGLITSLERQLRDYQSQEVTLGRKIQSAQSSGDNNGAQIFAQQLARIRKSIQTTSNELNQARQLQETYLNQIREAQASLQTSKQEVKTLDTQRKMHQSSAKLSSTNLDGSNLDDAIDNIRDVAAAAAGAAIVNQTLASDFQDNYETEDILKEFGGGGGFSGGGASGEWESSEDNSRESDD